ncbi:hypothetical protein QM042_02615 [Escherichia coli]|uniref:hypothetical protein n=1 Tax=Escherichia coli TaxID=562 RepID=UPI0039856DD9
MTTEAADKHRRDLIKVSAATAELTSPVPTSSTAVVYCAVKCNSYSSFYAGGNLIGLLPAFRQLESVPFPKKTAKPTPPAPEIMPLTLELVPSNWVLEKVILGSFSPGHLTFSGKDVVFE